jgi:hypothetical protein
MVKVLWRRILKMFEEHSDIQSAWKGAHWMMLSFFFEPGIFVANIWPTRTFSFFELQLLRQRQPFGVTWAPQAGWRPEISRFVGGTDGAALQCFFAAVDCPCSMAEIGIFVKHAWIRTVARCRMMPWSHLNLQKPITTSHSDLLSIPFCLAACFYRLFADLHICLPRTQNIQKDIFIV